MTELLEAAAAAKLKPEDQDSLAAAILEEAAADARWAAAFHQAPKALEQLADEEDPDAIRKYQIVRQVLIGLNERGEGALRERREVLRRVVEFEDFSTCWPADQMKAKGFVAEVRRIVNVKDSFTRMKAERERETASRMAERDAQADKIRKHHIDQDKVRHALGAALAEPVPQRRGILLETAVTQLFKCHGILVRESFPVVGEKSPGVIEQIDGVIELVGELYLVEVKCLTSEVSVDDVSRHLVRVYHRHSSRGLFVSSTPFSRPAVKTCTEALQRTVVTLCLWEELIEVLEHHGDLRRFLKVKVQAAVVDKKPFVRLRLASGTPGAV